MKKIVIYTILSFLTSSVYAANNNNHTTGNNNTLNNVTNSVIVGNDSTLNNLDQALIAGDNISITGDNFDSVSVVGSNNVIEKNHGGDGDKYKGKASVMVQGKNNKVLVSSDGDFNQAIVIGDNNDVGRVGGVPIHGNARVIGYDNKIMNGNILGHSNNIKQDENYGASANILGNSNSGQTQLSNVVGDNNQFKSNGLFNNTIGYGNVLTGSSNTIIGNNSTAANGSLVFGDYAHAFDGGIAIGNNSTASAGQVGFGDRVLTGVKQGINNSDAVNVSQLNTAKAEAISTSKNHTTATVNQAKAELSNQIDTAKNEAVTSANTYTDTKVNDVKVELDTKIDTVKNELNNKIENATNEAVASSNTYTDNKVEAAKTELNQTISDTADKTLASANKYTDDKIVNVTAASLDEAKKYTDVEVSKSKIELSGQIKESASATLTESKNYTTIKHNESLAYTDKKSSETLSQANAYTDSKVTFLNDRMNKLDEKINNVRNEANAGTAAAMAMASMPIKAGYRYSLTMGMAGYVDQNAIAMGVKLNTTDNSIITMNASYDSQNNVGLGLGLAIGIN